MTPNFWGADLNSSAPVESTTISSTRGAGGIVIGTEPAAIMTWSAVYYSFFPEGSVTSTILLAINFAVPKIE